MSLGTDIWKQDFQDGTIFHGPKGSYLLVGTLHYNYYNVLSDSDRQRLGMPISNETNADNYWHQYFEHGELQLGQGQPVKWIDGGGSQSTQSAGVAVGFDGTSAHNTYINTFNHSGGQGSIGQAFNNVHRWGNGYTQDFQGGGESRGAIMKSDANDNSYWVGSNFWTTYLTANGADGILGYPTSDRYPINGGQRQDFQGGAIISGSRGTFLLYGGINGQYNNEGANNGRLGLPTSGEVGIGGGKIVQHFEQGDILYSNGKANTIYTRGSTVNYKDFSGWVRSGVGLNVRQGPSSVDTYVTTIPYNAPLTFDTWTRGESIQGNNDWYHIAGTNNWVAGAYIGDTAAQVSTGVILPNVPNFNDNSNVQPNSNNGNNNSYILNDLPSLEIEIPFPYEKAAYHVTEIGIPLVGEYLIQGFSNMSVSGGVTVISSSDVAFGNEDLVKINNFLNGVALKKNVANPTVPIFEFSPDQRLSLSSGINGNLFTGKIYGELTASPAFKSLFGSKFDVKASLNFEFSGSYHRRLYGSPLEKIFEFAKIVVASGENLDNAMKVFLESDLEVANFIKSGQTGLLVAGGVLAVGTILADIFTGGASIADDPVTLGIAARLIEFGSKPISIGALQYAH